MYEIKSLVSRLLKLIFKHLDFIVFNNLFSFAVIKIIIMYSGGSSNVFNKELKEISKDTEQQKALNEVVHSIKKYSLEYRSRHVTDMKELQTLMEEKRKLQTLQISF